MGVGDWHGEEGRKRGAGGEHEGVDAGDRSDAVGKVTLDERREGNVPEGHAGHGDGAEGEEGDRVGGECAGELADDDEGHCRNDGPFEADAAGDRGSEDADTGEAEFGECAEDAGGGGADGEVGADVPEHGGQGGDGGTEVEADEEDAGEGEPAAAGDAIPPGSCRPRRDGARRRRGVRFRSIRRGRCQSDFPLAASVGKRRGNVTATGYEDACCG